MRLFDLGHANDSVGQPGHYGFVACEHLGRRKWAFEAYRLNVDFFDRRLPGRRDFRLLEPAGQAVHRLAACAFGVSVIRGEELLADGAPGPFEAVGRASGSAEVAVGGSTTDVDH